MRYIPVFLLILLLVGCGNTTSSTTVDMYNQDGDMIGTANFSEGKESVSIELKVKGIETGYHAVSIHEFPKCKGPEFKSAGNHLNPENKQHGLMNDKGAHLGDLPNVKADDKGAINAELSLPEATLKEGKMSLFKEKGTSIIISKKKDDGMTQPSGNSGARIACGVIQNENQAKKGTSPTDPTESEDSDEESI